MGIDMFHVTSVEETSPNREIKNSSETTQEEPEKRVRKIELRGTRSASKGQAAESGCQSAKSREGQRVVRVPTFNHEA